MRRRASPLHALLVPAPPPGALGDVATGAAICIRPHGPLVRTLPRVAHSMRPARAEAANGGPGALRNVPVTTEMLPGEAAKGRAARLRDMESNIRGSVTALGAAAQASPGRAGAATAE